MQLRKGTLLHGGTYRIIDVLGQGSFGITYLAELIGFERLRLCGNFLRNSHK